MANLFDWDAKLYSTSVTSMDNEHQKLINLMNNLYSLHQKKASSADIAKALKEFVNYTVTHFTDEEKYMESIKYAEIETHKLIHKRLLEKATEFVNKFEKEGKLSDEFFGFLKTWLSAHIRGVDMKYSAKSKAA